MTPIYAVGGFQAPYPSAQDQGFNGWSRNPDARQLELILDRMSIAAPNEIYIAGTAFTSTSGRSEKGESEGTHAAVEVVTGMHGKAKPGNVSNEPILSQIQMQPLESYWCTRRAEGEGPGLRGKASELRSQQEVSREYLIHGGPEERMGRRAGRIAGIWAIRRQRLCSRDGETFGSTGYGQKFIDAINGNWGGAPYQDLMLQNSTTPSSNNLFIDKDREWRWAPVTADTPSAGLRATPRASECLVLATTACSDAVSVQHDERALVQRMGVQRYAVGESRASTTSGRRTCLRRTSRNADAGCTRPARLPARRFGGLPVVHHFCNG